jgi:hypothetical protein
MLKRTVNFGLLTVDDGHQTVNLAGQVRCNMVSGGYCCVLEWVIKGWRSRGDPFYPCLNPTVQVAH